MHDTHNIYVVIIIQYAYNKAICQLMIFQLTLALNACRRREIKELAIGGDDHQRHQNEFDIVVQAIDEGTIEWIKARRQPSRLRAAAHQFSRFAFVVGVAHRIPDLHPQVPSPAVSLLRSL